MQSFQDGAAHAPNIAQFLYDGLPPAAQEFLRSPTHDGAQFKSKRRESSLTEELGLSNLRRLISRTKVLLLVAWIITLSWGEKHSFRSHVAKCKWENWERWVSL
jgi:hypothetical protein